jgi:hypothetical protein
MSRDEPLICPVCGAEVPARARACPECGADEKTGWSDDAIYDGTGIEEADEFDYDEWLRRERGLPPKRSPLQWLWWAVAAVVLAAVVWWLVLGR